LSTAFGGLERDSPLWRAQGRDELLDLIRTQFAARYAAPLTLDNNTRLAALGEAVWGQSSETDSLLFIRLSDGVGGGLVVGGRLISGASAAAGEIGHVTVEPEGLQCWCGKNGCLETVASAPAIRERLAALQQSPGLGGQADVIRRAAEATGRVLAAIAVVMDPRDVVIAGDVLRFPGFAEAASSAFARETLPVGAGSRLRVSTLRDEAGALGAITAAFHRSPLLFGYPGLAAIPNPTDPERLHA
jgi:predicted NBD/HSP70 family sugar kinase